MQRCKLGGARRDGEKKRSICVRGTCGFAIQCLGDNRFNGFTSTREQRLRQHLGAQAQPQRSSSLIQCTGYPQVSCHPKDTLYGEPGERGEEAED